MIPMYAKSGSSLPGRMTRASKFTLKIVSSRSSVRSQFSNIDELAKKLFKNSF